MHAIAFVLGFQLVLLLLGQTADVLVETYMTLLVMYGLGVFVLGPLVWALNAFQILVSIAALAWIWGAVRGRWQRTNDRLLAWQAVGVMGVAGVLVVAPVAVGAIALAQWGGLGFVLVAGWEQWVALALLLPVAVAARSEEPKTSPARVDLAVASGAVTAATVLGAVVPVGLLVGAFVDPSLIADPFKAALTWLLRASAAIPGLAALLAVAVARDETGRLRAAIGTAVAMAVSVVGYFFVIAWPSAVAALVAMVLTLVACRTASLEARYQSPTK